MESTEFLEKTIHERQIERINTADLVPYARNANQHSDYQIKLIAHSMRKYGWTSPVLVDERLNIIAGHGRVMAAEQMGVSTVPCIRLEGLSDADRRAYLLADNQLANMSTWDHELLATEMVELEKLDVDLVDLGFDDKFISRLLEPADAGAGPPADVKPELTVVVECRDESEQAALFEELSGRGLKCHIMT